MFRIAKQLKGQEVTVLCIVLLLLVQAFCDLSLPQYTSDIIDQGIQNSGVEYVMPESIREEEFQYARLFMTEEESEKWEIAYDKKGTIYQCNLDKKKRKEMEEEFVYPLIASSQMSAVEKDVFIRQVASQAEKKESEITDEFLQAYASELGIELKFFQKDVTGSGGKSKPKTCLDMRTFLSAMLQNGMMKQESLLEMREQMEEGFSAMGDSLVKATAISYTVAEEKASGVNVNQKQTNYLWLSGGKMLAVALLMVVAAIGVGYLASKAGAAVGRNLRGRVFKRVVEFSDAEMNQFSTASLITRSTNDIQQIQMVIAMMLRMVAYAPIIGIGGVFKVIQTGAGMGWVIVLAVLVIMSIVLILMVIAMPKFKLMQKLVDRLNLVSREILTGLLVIRAFGREKKEEERFEEANKNLTQTMLFTNRVMTFMMPLMMFLMYGLSVVIVWVAAHRIDTGNMQVGTMTAFIIYAMQIVMSFLMITMMSIMLPRAAVAADRIDEVLNTESTVKNKPDAQKLECKDGVVRFENVGFRYPGADGDALMQVDFVAKPGQTTAIIGSTGSGKSTLINLIPRFYDVTQGRITIDGQDIRDITQESLHALIGYVPQKGILFSGTISSNLRYGREDASQEELERAAVIAQSEEFILDKEEGYESPIAQGGSNVSGGQKQRLSIARAIARKPKIYLFDDSFSALDFKTDAALRKALNENVKDSTVFIVAQRISTILHADQILVLDEGSVAGKGTHEELLKNCEVYRQIARSQLSDKELGISESEKKSNGSLTGKEEVVYE